MNDYLNTRDDPDMFPYLINSMINVVGTIQKFGIRPKINGGFRETILLVNVNMGGLLCDHLWIDYLKSMYCQNLNIGDQISFVAIGRFYKSVSGKLGVKKIRQLKKINN